MRWKRKKRPERRSDRLQLTFLVDPTDMAAITTAWILGHKNGPEAEAFFHACVAAGWDTIGFTSKAVPVFVNSDDVFGMPSDTSPLRLLNIGTLEEIPNGPRAGIAGAISGAVALQPSIERAVHAPENGFCSRTTGF